MEQEIEENSADNREMKDVNNEAIKVPQSDDATETDTQPKPEENKTDTIENIPDNEAEKTYPDKSIDQLNENLQKEDKPNNEQSEENNIQIQEPQETEENNQEIEEKQNDQQTEETNEQIEEKNENDKNNENNEQIVENKKNNEQIEENEENINKEPEEYEIDQRRCSLSPRIAAIKEEWASKRRFVGNGLPLIVCLRCNNHFFVELTKPDQHFTATARQKNLKFAFCLIPDQIETDIYQLIHIESGCYVSVRQIGEHFTLYPINNDDNEFTIINRKDLCFKIIKISNDKEVNLRVYIGWNNKLLTLVESEYNYKQENTFDDNAINRNNFDDNAIQLQRIQTQTSYLGHLDGTDKILIFKNKLDGNNIQLKNQIFSLERITDDLEDEGLNIIFLLDLVSQPRQSKIGIDLIKLKKYKYIPNELNELIQQIYVRIDINKTGYAFFTEVWTQFVQYSQGMISRVVINTFEEGIKNNDCTYKLIHIRDIIRCIDTIFEFYSNEIKMEKLQIEKEKALKELDPIDIKLRRLDTSILYQHPFLKEWQNMSSFRRKLYDWKIYIFDKWNSGGGNDAGFFLWRAHLVSIQSNFGESIFAFFQFTRWLMILNCIMCLFYGFLIFTHCLSFDFLSFNSQQYIDMALGNEFTYSWWFYGAYKSEYEGIIINYNVSFMWIVVSVCSAVVSVIAVLRVLLNSSTQNDDEYIFSKNVFANYNHSLSHPDAITLQQNSLMIQLHETLLQRLDAEGNKLTFILLLKRLFGIILCLIIGAISAVGIVALIYFEQSIIIPFVHNNYPAMESMAPYIVPAGVSVIKGMTPHIVRAIVLFEHYSAEFLFQQTFFRVFVLRVFAILVTLFQTAQTAENTENDEGAACAESQIGMVLYKFILFDMIIEIMFYFVLPGIKYCCGRCCGSIKKLSKEQELEELNRKSTVNLVTTMKQQQEQKQQQKTEFELAGDSWKAQFDIPGALVDVMYRQGIVWSGMYFSPMISLLAVIASSVTFFVKKRYLFYYCARPKKALGVTKQLKFFYGMMLLAIITSFVPFNYLLNRTPLCGPHKNKNVLNEAELTLDQDMPSFLQTFFQYAFNGLLLLPLFILSLVYLGYVRGVRNASIKNATLLKTRLLKEKDEKKQILKDYNIRL